MKKNIVLIFAIIASILLLASCSVNKCAAYGHYSYVPTPTEQTAN
jgi:PBP1b-binding outer membrane lipoprotein LpoB